MIVVNTPVALTWLLNKTATAYTEANFDLVIISPDGDVTFDDDLTQTSFVAPTADTEGSIATNLTFTEEGLFTVQLVTGTSTSYTVHSSTQLSVVAATTAETITVTKLP